MGAPAGQEIGGGVGTVSTGVLSLLDSEELLLCAKLRATKTVETSNVIVATRETIL